MDSTKSKDASYIGKTIARFFDRTSSTWSKVHSKFLKERIRSEDVEGCKNEARDGKMTILACLRISRDLEYVENSKREIGNTIRQWKFNAVAIRSVPDAPGDVANTCCRRHISKGDILSYIFIFVNIHQHAKHARHGD